MLGEFREVGLHRATLATPGVAIHNLKNVAEQPYCAISTKVRQKMIGSQYGRVTPGLRLPTVPMYQTE